MSHELRTPLAAIIGYGELLSDGITGPINDEQKRQLGRIRASANHLLSIIDEILTLARMEAGKEKKSGSWRWTFNPVSAKNSTSLCNLK